MGSISFKVFLQYLDDVEIRRFGMSGPINFTILKKKITEVFPSLNGRQFTIHWKDEENDDVTISSDSDVDEYLLSISPETLHRLYISLLDPADQKSSCKGKPINTVLLGSFMDIAKTNDADANDAETNDSEDDDDDDDDDEVQEDDTGLLFPGCKRSWQSALLASPVKHHPFVYCDGCNKHISSHRYKCMECSDFDLCLNCESKNLHKEHIMLRIPLTMSHYTKLNHFGKSIRYMSDMLRKIENRIRKQERRVQKTGGNLSWGDYYGFGTEIPNSKRCKRDDKEKDKKDRKDKKDKKDKKETKERPCNSSAAAGSGSQPSKAKESSEKGGCPFPGGFLSSFLSPQTLGTILSQQNLNTLQQLFEQVSPVPEQLLQEMAQNLAAVRLSDPAPSAPASGSTAQPGNPFAANIQANVTTTETDGAAPSTSSAPQTPSKERAKPDEAQGNTPSEVSVQTEGNQTDTSAAPQSGRSSRSSSEEADPDGWTVLDAQVRDSAMYPKLPQVDPTPVHAQAPQVADIDVPPPAPVPVVPAEPELFHSDPDVHRCLACMSEMGYDIHQNMIIDLAEEYKGNVGRVLNALLS